MRFADVIGQQRVKELLVRTVDSGRVSHAQMLCGEPGYGTLPMALAYIQYVNCADPIDGDSCGRCASCVKISQLAHPDMHMIMPVNSTAKQGSGKPVSDWFLPKWRETVVGTGGYFDEAEWYQAIDIENKQGAISRTEADEIIRKLSFKSYEGRYKTILIWLPERMNPTAANVLLKILEEPWAGTLFMLVCQSPASLLPTILSRVQRIDVPPVAPQDIEGFLIEGKGMERSRAGEVSRLCQGDVIRALAISRNQDDRAPEVVFDLFRQLMRLSFNDRHIELLEWADTLCSMGREEQKRFFSYSARMLRESYMISAGMAEISSLTGDEAEFCSRFAPFIANHNIEKLIDELTLASAHISSNGNPRIVIPHFALSVSKMINKI